MTEVAVTGSRSPAGADARARRLQALRSAGADDDRCAPVEAGAVPEREARAIHAHLHIQSHRRRRSWATTISSRGAQRSCCGSKTRRAKDSASRCPRASCRSWKRAAPLRCSPARTTSTTSLWACRSSWSSDSPMDVWIEPRVTEEQTIVRSRSQRAALQRRSAPRQRQARADHARISPAERGRRLPHRPRVPRAHAQGRRHPVDLPPAGRAAALSCVTRMQRSD